MIEVVCGWWVVDIGGKEDRGEEGRYMVYGVSFFVGSSLRL